MKQRILCCGIAAILFGWMTGKVGAATAPVVPQSDTAPAVALGNAFASIVEHTRNSIVAVLSEKLVKFHGGEFPFPFSDPFFRQFFGNPNGPAHQQGIPVSGLGSGFILDDLGHILTNNHVVQGMENIRVVLPDKESFSAKVLGTDAKTDIAVLQIKGSFPKSLPSVRLGDSDDLKPGNLVLAFGAPFGLTQTVTSGIISAVGRSDVGIADFEDFLQTDAPINPGNSGGPLVNMRGEVIGMDTAIATSAGQSAGVGFAIPINMAKDILPTLLQGKKVVRGMLGVGVQDVTPPLEKQFHLPNAKGALVSQVNPGSPADQAGIKTGDVIVSVGGKSIDDSRELRELISRSKPGTREDVTLIRDGKQMKVAAKLGQLGTKVAQAFESAPANASLQKFGIEAETLTPELRSEFKTKEKKGVVITQVDPVGAAAMAGLRPGDVITQVDRQKAESLGAADQILAKSNNPTEVVLLVNHKGSTTYVVLETG